MILMRIARGITFSIDTAAAGTLPPGRIPGRSKTNVLVIDRVATDRCYNDYAREDSSYFKSTTVFSIEKWRNGAKTCRKIFTLLEIFLKELVMWPEVNDRIFY